MALNLYGRTEMEILSQVRGEHDYGYRSVENVREQRRQDLEAYFDAKADDSKVRIRTIFQTHRMLMAIAWANRPKVVWRRRRTGDYERAQNCNRVMKYDYKEMGMGPIDYQTESDRFLKGVGIQVSGGYSAVRNIPKIENVDALCWIPDPDGGPTIDSHRFAGFEVKMTKAEMKRNGYHNVDKASQAAPTDNDTARKEAANVTVTVDDTEHALMDLYVHYFSCDGKKYRIVTDSSIAVIHSLEYLKPVTLEEKEDESLVPFPISLKYYFYVSGNPLGISVPDLTRDSQSAVSKLFNLYLAMAYRNTFGGDRLVRVDQLLDPASLATPTIEGKDIPVVEGAQALQDIVYELPRESTNAIPQNMIELLRQNAENVVGAGSLQQGVAGQTDATLGEAQMAQANGNLQFLLMENVGVWGEEAKWKNLWFRQYVANMKSADRKEVSLNVGATETFDAFRKEDFVSPYMLALEIVSSGQAKQDRQTNKPGKIFLLQTAYAQAKSESEKATIIREWASLEEMDDETTNVIASKTPDEIKAEMKLALINEDDMAGAEIDSLDEDHYAYIRIFQTADPTKAKKEAIRRRYEAIAYMQAEAKAKAQAEQGANAAGASSTGANATDGGLAASQSQMAAGMMQSMQQQPSLQQVSA